MIPLLLIVAVIGFVLGIRSPDAPHTALAPKTRSAFVANLIVEYPSTWHTTRTPIALPGLQLTHELVLAPDGNAARAGLMAGQIAGTAKTPLPASFLASLGGAPHTEVVQQPYLEAYRYRQLRLAGQPRTVDLYVIPGGSETSEQQNATGVACYAEPRLAAYLRKCEQIVAHIALSSPTGAGTLIDASYARRLDGVIGSLPGERDRLLAAARHARVNAAVSRQAAQLGGRFAAAASSLSSLEAPSNATAAQSALASALGQSAESYRALATGSTDAAARISQSEAALQGAIAKLAVLGYGSTPARR